MNSLNINRCASSKGSINRHMINGVSAYDYFSPKQIINELKSNTRLYFNNDLNTLKQADYILNLKTSDSKVVEEIIYKFGLRLAEILYIFENPSIEQMNHRKDYSKEDWDYLKSIKRIYIAGGLLTKEFSLIFEKALEDYFSKNCFNKEVIFITESSNLALEGLTKVITNNSLVYDFGQTNVKNGVYRNKELIIKDPITVSISKQADLKLYASNCNNFILDVLLNQLKSNPDITEINMAISNYVNNGVIDPAPWYYGVLYYFKPDYEEFLREKLSEILKKEIKVKLYHDTTAMGYSIKEKENAMLISLGTAFGVCYFD